MNTSNQSVARKFGVIASALVLVATMALFIDTAPASGQTSDSAGDTVQITGATKAVKAGTANHVALITVLSSNNSPITECHGALISSTYVLGSSGCANVAGAATTIVTLGATNVANPIKRDFETRTAVSVVTHPNAGDAAWGTFAYEMALYKLNKASTRRPAILGTASQTGANGAGVLQGYGPTTNRGNDGGTLRSGKVSFSSRARTIEILNAVGLPTSGAPFSDFILSDGASSSHVKSCDDPGAPVIKTVKGKPTLLALASREFVFQGGSICNDALDEYFHFYFNVTSATTSNWITSVVGKTGPTKDAKCSGKWATLFGGSGNDVIWGTGGNDVIVGLGGNDTINGARGKDRICGGTGVDRMLGGAGKDICDGGGGKDKKPKQCETKKKI